MKDDKYSIYSKFDIDSHKKTYVNYLEVIIDSDGQIMYAIPSHTRKAEELARQALNLKTIQDVKALCPKDRYADYMEWLLEQCNCIAVWNTMCSYTNINTKQYMTLRSLKLNGLYKGELPPRPRK